MQSEIDTRGECKMMSVVKHKIPGTLSGYRIGCAGPDCIIRDTDEEVSEAFTTDHTFGAKLILSHGVTNSCFTFSPLLRTARMLRNTIINSVILI